MSGYPTNAVYIHSSVMYNHFFFVSNQAPERSGLPFKTDFSRNGISLSALVLWTGSTSEFSAPVVLDQPTSTTSDTIVLSCLH